RSTRTRERSIQRDGTRSIRVENPMRRRPRIGCEPTAEQPSSWPEVQAMRSYSVVPIHVRGQSYYSLVRVVRASRPLSRTRKSAIVLCREWLLTRSHRTERFLSEEIASTTGGQGSLDHQ